MELTPTYNSIPMRLGDFPTLAQALDYAATGNTGFNFYSGRGALQCVLSYTQLRERALQTAGRLIALGAKPGDRVALVADTVPEFLDCFFACQYTGLVPVPMPVTVGLGSRDAYIRQLQGLLTACEASIALGPEALLSFLQQAAQGQDLLHLGSFEALGELPVAAALPPIPGPEATAYLQFTSGSTQFPRGVVITQAQVMQNLSSILKLGVCMREEDRLVSWLPMYHDMGLVGFVLTPVASQRSVDYLATRDFAMRPRLWLKLISENRGSIAFSPTFGYELCARRMRRGVEGYDLSSWRVAGVGAETIRKDVLHQFANVLGAANFNESAFMPCYGMAECSLAISFAPISQGLLVDRIDAVALADRHVAEPVVDDTAAERVSEFVVCGQVLPEYDMEIRDCAGQPLPDREVGTVMVRGPSVMSGYFRNAEATQAALSADGWLNTGDMGYRIGDKIVITGRAKDLMIVNGRNIWPQDLEWLVEHQPELRSGDALAFSAPSAEGPDAAVLVMQCRVREPEEKQALIKRIEGLIRRELGIECLVDAVAPHTLPRTSSGKLSRAGARRDYIARLQRNVHQRQRDRIASEAATARSARTG